MLNHQFGSVTKISLEETKRDEISRKKYVNWVVTTSIRYDLIVNTSTERLKKFIFTNCVKE